MTMKEFLAERLGQDSTQTGKIVSNETIQKALNAITKLHRPFEDSETQLCEECTRISPIRIKYPCPTIQAVEKELG
jgi:hypothetical protein